MMRRKATQLALVDLHDPRQVQAIHEIDDEVGQVAFWQPLMWRRRKQVTLPWLVGTKRLGHAARRSHRDPLVDLPVTLLPHPQPLVLTGRDVPRRVARGLEPRRAQLRSVPLAVPFRRDRGAASTV